MMTLIATCLRPPFLSAQRLVAVLLGSGLVIGGLVCRRLIGGQVEHANVSFAVSPKGNQIVFAAADDNLYLFDLKTSQVTSFARSPIQKSAPTFSPNGGTIAYAEGTGKEDGKHLFARSLDGKQIRQLTQDANVYDTQPSYSPDGKRLVFARAARRRPYSMGGWTWDQWDIWTVNVDGTHLQRITNQKYYQLQSPMFGVDEQQIVYNAYQENLSALYVVASHPNAIPKSFGGRPVSGQKGGSWASQPYLAHNGRRVAFISDRAVPFEYDILLMNTNETNVQSLGMTSISRYNQNPVLVPDEGRLLFLAGREWNAGSRPIFSLWEVNTAHKKARQIANSELFTDPIHWKPSH